MSHGVCLRVLMVQTYCVCCANEGDIILVEVGCGIFIKCLMLLV